MSRFEMTLAVRREFGWEFLVWSLGGLSFWFWLAVPFCNHNESYLWVALFNSKSAFQVLTTKLEATATFRPLGQALAYCAYRLGGDSIVLPQILNYIVSVSAWALLLVTSTDRRKTAWLSALVGGGYFAGYVYLFHLHGVFYGPVLVLIPLLVWLYDGDAKESKKDLALAVACGICFLFHPYALIIGLSFLLGLILEGGPRVSMSTLSRRLLLVFGGTLALLYSNPGHNKLLVGEGVRGLVRSFELLEGHPALRALSFVLAMAAVMGLPTGRRGKAVAAGLVVIGAVFLVSLGLPLIFLWFAVCALGGVLRKQWPSVLTLGATVLLPGIAPSGSPTYGVYALMVCVVLMSSGPRTNRELAPSSAELTLMRLTIAASIIVAIAVRADFTVPMVSKLANPLLAEKEKTCQLQEIIDWWMRSDFRNFELVFKRVPQNPVSSESAALQRRNRPPTYQSYLDAYLKTVVPSTSRGSGSNQLVVTFGGEEVPGLRLVRSFGSDHAGEARVYR